METDNEDPVILYYTDDLILQILRRMLVVEEINQPLDQETLDEHGL